MLKFAKGSGKAKSPVRTPDTLNSTDTVELLLGVSEGPIKGLVAGPKSFYVADTALLNENGNPNYSSFALQFWPGNELGHEVKMELGGFSNPIEVNQVLAQNMPVTRSGVTTNIDAIDFRIVVQQLLKQNDDGVFTAPLSLKFEIKKTTDAAWQPAWIADVSSEVPEIGDTGGGTDAFWQYFGGQGADVATFNGDVEVYTSPLNPTVEPGSAAIEIMHVNTTDGSVWAWGNGDWNQVAAGPEVTEGAWKYKELADGRRQYLSLTAPTGARVGDIWMFIFKAFVWNGAQWINKSDYVAQAPETIQSGIWTCDEKVTSPTAKDLRVYVEPDPDARWEFRVTKLSEDSGTVIQSVVSWESIQEIKRAPMTFKGVSMIRVIGKASDQFTSLPQWSGDFDGRVVKVPSNYDPETRTFAGIWDGTYKIAWTNNPAFIFQDFVENETYGLSSVYPHIVNKWRIYEWARYCDVKIQRPDGTYRPRWTFNDYLQQPRDAKEMANYIAGAAGARYVDDGNGIVDVIIDRDEDAVALFTAENVGEDGFSYSYTDRLTRSNQILVEFVNPALNWRADKRLVEWPEDIAQVGVISENFIAVGCTDEDEALARARRRLIGGLTEKELVTFTTNRQGRFLSEMDVILVSDPDMGRGISGRIKKKLGVNHVSLRDPVTFESNIDYEATFTVVNPNYPVTEAEPFKTVTLPISNTAGTFTELHFGGALPADLPEQAVFAISAEGHIGMPKPYRVTGIEDDSGTGEVVRITALELNRNKYAYIDTGIDDGEIDYGSSGDVQPPANLRILTEIKQRGQVSTRVATLMWDRSPTKFVRSYEITHTLDGVAKPAPAPTSDLRMEFEGIADGDHYFSVVAIDLFGRRSKPAVVRYNTNGVFPVNGQFNFRLTNGVNAEQFESLEPTFAWDQITLIPNFDHWEVVVFHPELDLPVRVENVGNALSWTYKYETNKADHAGLPPRELLMGLRAVDQYGNSSQPDRLTVRNLAPPPPTGIRVVVDMDALLVTWNTIPAINDFGGSRIHVSDGTVTPTPAMLKFEGTGNQARIPLLTTANYAILVGHYDLYRPDETIYGDVISQNVDKLVKELIDGLDEVVEAVEEIQQEIDQKLEEVASTIEGAENLAEDLISNRLAHIAEVAERERLTFFEGQEVGSVAHQALLKADDSAEFLTILGTRSEDGESILFNQERVRVSETESLGERLNTIQATFDGDHQSYLLDQITVTANATGAVLDTINLIGVESGEGADKVFVLNTSKLKVTPTESLFSRLETIEAKFGGDTRTALLDQIEAAADEATAAMTRTQAMGAWSGDNSALTLDLIKVKVGPSETLGQRLQSLVVSNSQIDARADSRISVSLGPGGAIASSINSVSVTANGAANTAAIALSAAQGNSSVAVLATVGDKVTGLKINGSTGSFGILASRFFVVDDNQGNPIVPFLYSLGTLYLRNTVVDGNLLVNGTITGSKIVGGAVSNLLPYENNSPMFVGISAMNQHLSFSYTSEGGKHLVQVYGELGTTSNNPAGAVIRLYCNGNLVGVGGIYCPGSWGGVGLTFPVAHTPGAGTHNYTVYYTGTGGSGSMQANRTLVVVTELKK